MVLEVKLHGKHHAINHLELDPWSSINNLQIIQSPMIDISGPLDSDMTFISDNSPVVVAALPPKSEVVPAGFAPPNRLLAVPVFPNRDIVTYSCYSSLFKIMDTVHSPIRLNYKQNRMTWEFL